MKTGWILLCLSSRFAELLLEFTSEILRFILVFTGENVVKNWVDIVVETCVKTDFSYFITDDFTVAKKTTYFTATSQFSLFSPLFSLMFHRCFTDVPPMFSPMLANVSRTFSQMFSHGSSFVLLHISLHLWQIGLFT